MESERIADTSKDAGASTTTSGRKKGQTGQTAAARSQAMRLQQGAGNRAAAHLLRVAQPKLEVGPSGDHFEQEADSVADRVVEALRRSSAGTQPADEQAAEPVATTPVVQRISRVQRSATVGAEGGAVEQGVEQQINAARGGGSKLPDNVKAPMESAFGSSFDDVKVHTGGQSDQLNDSISAKAFTVGSDIFFKGGMPDTSSSSGQQLVAHELTHVVQQRGGSGPAQRVQRWDNPFEGVLDKIYNFVFGGDEEKETGEAESQDAEQEKAEQEKAEQEKADKVAAAKQKEADEERLKQQADAKAKAEEKARIDQENKAREEAEAKAKAEQEAAAKAKADEEARLAKEAEEKAAVEAEEQAKKDAEAKAAKEAEEQAKKDAEAKAAKEAEEKAKKEAEEKAKKEAEAKAKKEAEEKAKKEAQDKEDLKYKTTAQINGLKLPALIKYVDEEPNWAKRSTITPEEKAAIESIVSFAREVGVVAALGFVSVSELRALPDLPAAVTQLRFYVTATTKNDPIKINPASTLDDAQWKGWTLSYLLWGFPRWVLSTALTAYTFDFLAKNQSWTTAIVDYYKNSVPKPIFEADNGKDFLNWMIAHEQEVDPITWHTGALAGYVRNFHRFNERALTQLEKNFNDGNTAGLPLTLILHSALDHNGAFHRDGPLADLVNDAHNFVLMIEGGESIAEYQSQIGPIATQYGVNGKIDQVMFAGHGNARDIQLAGTVQESSSGELAEVDDGISLDADQAGADALFDEVLRNMETEVDAKAQNLLDPNAAKYRRILFNACLTNSNTFNAGLQSDVAKDRETIRDSIKQNASLATYLGNKAKADGYGDISSLGANASIGVVDLVDSSGALDMVSSKDPFVTSSKLVYMEKGVEPLGVLRAALEAWAHDDVKAIEAMERRVAAAPVGWANVVITTIYKDFLKQKGSPKAGIILRRWAQAVSPIAELDVDAECKVSKVEPYLPAYKPEIKILIGGILGAGPASNATPELGIVLMQLAFAIDGSQKAAQQFPEILEHIGLTAKGIMKTKDQYLDTKFLLTQGLLVPALTGPPSKGKTLLALVALLDGGAPAEGKAYLKPLINPGAPEIPELPEVAAVELIEEKRGARALVPKVDAVKGRDEVVEIPGKRPHADAIPDLEELPELAAVKDKLVSGPLPKDVTERPKVLAEGRKGRAKREVVPKVPAVKPFFPDDVFFTEMVDGRASEDDIIKQLNK